MRFSQPSLTHPVTVAPPVTQLRVLFSENLRLTFSSLLTNATHGDRFYNTSTSRGSDEAYGLFLCRGDVTHAQCQSCVEANIQRIQSDCPNRTAVLWDDYCMLRYADRSMFSIMEESPQINRSNENNVSDPDGFNATLMNLMDSLVMNVPSSNMFATGTVKLPAGDTLYALVQCTPDISLPHCKECLSGSIQQIPICCGGKKGGIVLRPSCNIRYENYTFLEAAAAEPGPSDTSPPAWKHWKGDTPLELVDPNLRDSYARNEIMKCIHIGLSCVEEDPADRPIMASIVHTLNSLSVTLPLPRQPAFLLQNRIESNMPERESDQSTSHSAPLSVNEVSITELYPR
ncbi:hypothetical protein L1049_009639 [Liquidambar formosana]|uniref:Gnk2-homologous domain-containing protein n=1 Tax=Liquidambar formosana TaxID=63359 RepID=A0AAP0N9L1_LIQFO